MTTDPFGWARSLDTLFDQAWTRLSRGVHDRHAAARHPTLATASARGRPQARTVVLRAADKGNGAILVYTDLQSHKVAELRISPFAALHIWDSSAHLQIRLAASVSILTGPDVAELWRNMPDRACMGASRCRSDICDHTGGVCHCLCVVHEKGSTERCDLRKLSFCTRKHQPGHRSRVSSI